MNSTFLQHNVFVETVIYVLVLPMFYTSAVLLFIENVGIPCTAPRILWANARLTTCALYFRRPSLATWASILPGSCIYIALMCWRTLNLSTKPLLDSLRLANSWRLSDYIQEFLLNQLGQTLIEQKVRNLGNPDHWHAIRPRRMGDMPELMAKIYHILTAKLSLTQFTGLEGSPLFTRIADPRGRAPCNWLSIVGVLLQSESILRVRYIV